MDLRTELHVPKASWTFGISDPVITLGSCFAATMGQRFADNKFTTLINPFGTVYHPLAVHRLLDYSVANQTPSRETYLNRDGVWYGYDFHSSLHASSADQLTDLLRERIRHVHGFLQNARVLILTYGTAWAYILREAGRSVGNCHRMPASLFEKHLTSPREMIKSFQESLRRLHELNPQLRIILTVSPVRHIKDTLTLNSVSKSALRLACHHLQEEEPLVDYFPSYEIILDDLRDYRFYQEDLLHPTAVAESYVWDKFSEAYYTDETRDILSTWSSIRKALLHRPFHPEHPEHQAFLRNTLTQLRTLMNIADVQQEIEDLEKRLTDQPGK